MTGICLAAQTKYNPAFLLLGQLLHLRPRRMQCALPGHTASHFTPVSVRDLIRSCCPLSRQTCIGLLYDSYSDCRSSTIRPSMPIGRLYVEPLHCMLPVRCQLNSKVKRSRGAVDRGHPLYPGIAVACQISKASCRALHELDCSHMWLRHVLGLLRKHAVAAGINVRC